MADLPSAQNSGDWDDVHTCHAECPCQTGGEPTPDFLSVEGVEARGSGYKTPKMNPTVNCPVCGAPAGYPCNADAEGEPLHPPHRERQQAEIEAMCETLGGWRYSTAGTWRKT